MNSYSNSEELEGLSNFFVSTDTKYDLDYEKRMVMYRILSEVERIADEKKLNRKDLAALIGTSPSYITQLFRGTKIINIETIAKFQKALDVTFEIKANQDNQGEAFSDLNLGQICEQQNKLRGFWTFHSFQPSYNQEEKQVVSLEAGYRRTA